MDKAQFLSLSPEEQVALIKQKQSQVSARPAAPDLATQVLEENAQKNATAEDLLGDKGRVAHSFGDKAGLAKALAAKGFVDVKQGPDGEIIARRADGSWVRDAARFSENPVNWLESKAGKALPLAGSILGAVKGSVVPVAGTVAGGAAGSGAGEAARIAIGKSLGTYEGDLSQAAGDVGEESLVGGLSGLGGQLIGKVAGKLAPSAVKAATPIARPSNYIPNLSYALEPVGEMLQRKAAERASAGAVAAIPKNNVPNWASRIIGKSVGWVAEKANPVPFLDRTVGNIVDRAAQKSIPGAISAARSGVSRVSDIISKNPAVIGAIANPTLRGVAERFHQSQQPTTEEEIQQADEIGKNHFLQSN